MEWREIQTSLVHRSKCSNLGRGGVVGAGRWEVGAVMGEQHEYSVSLTANTTTTTSNYYIRKSESGRQK